MQFHGAMHGGFHDHRPARASHADGLGQALLRAGRVDHPIVLGNGKLLAKRFRLHSGAGGNAKFFGMAAELVHVVSIGVQNLSDQQPELAIAQNGDRRTARQVCLIQDLASRRQRFDEDSLLNRQAFRNDVQIAFGKREKFPKCSWMLYDAQHGPLRAVASQAAPAPAALAAAQVDFADHPAAHQVRIACFNHLADKLMSRRSGEPVVPALQLQIGIADTAAQQAYHREAFWPAGTRYAADVDTTLFQMNRAHGLSSITDRYNRKSMPAELLCIRAGCAARFPVTEVIYNCPKCGGLLEADYPGWKLDPAALKSLWRQRRTSNLPLDQSGVWRYREFIPFLQNLDRVTTLREGNTPLLAGAAAAHYGGLDHLVFKHQGFNPTGSFKDNGMVCGVAQAVRLGMKRVACVSTGNTSASMAAYASAAGLEPLIFIPHGNIAYGKLAQALEYGARTFQVEANFDQILALVRELAERLGIYLLNSINPFRIEGQKTIMVELMDQRDWNPPDWVVLPGGNLGNTSAFGKALREMKAAGLIQKIPRLAVIQAEGSAPFYEMFKAGEHTVLPRVDHPETLATAIKIGDPISWPKALREVEESGGTVEKVTEQEIADAKAIIGRCGIGCEPASAATLAGIRKLTAAGVIKKNADVLAVLTGNVLKDPDYIYRYHTGTLDDPAGRRIAANFGNQPIVVANDAAKIASLL